MVVQKPQFCQSLVATATDRVSVVGTDEDEHRVLDRGAGLWPGRQVLCGLVGQGQRPNSSISGERCVVQLRDINMWDSGAVSDT